MSVLILALISIFVGFMIVVVPAIGWISGIIFGLIIWGLIMWSYEN